MKLINKRRQDTDNDEINITVDDTDGVNSETDTPTDDIIDDILPGYHDQLMADGNDNNDLTVKNNVK